MKVIQKKNKTELYSLRVDKDEMKMIKYLSKDKNIDLPQMLRSYVKEIYNRITLDEPDDIYSISS
jgi:hypothetical protein